MQGQNAPSETSEIALTPGAFAQLQDAAKGGVRTYVGPTLISQTGQETPVLYDHQQRFFKECSLRDTIRMMPIAEEGDYLVLENPAIEDKHPNLGEAKQDCPNLRMGSKVNIPGPTQFALWPSQHATLVPGHNLRSNQYLECRIYNEDAATANWQEATIRKAETATSEEDEEAEDSGSMVDDETRKFIAGQRLIIRGDEVSFFIPPTGIEVLADENEYVREAVTLERLEYCILVDEDGNKRYERGPQVVFPQPTEAFLISDGRRKFKAIELNPIQGLHIKVIADYNDNGSAVTDENRKDADHKEGDELFLTGEKHPIYFPGPEHSIIRYSNRNKQFATAVPPGEGRYVMHRLTGVIDKLIGPDMLLPDPRTKVIVKRILTENQSNLWYPDNPQALAYNRELTKVAESASIQSLGYLERDTETEATNVKTEGFRARSLTRREATGKAAMPDEFSRSTQYASPRTLTLDTKFEGVPQICPWTGYAVMVVDKSGRRRVEVGPMTILLNFDETLEILTLSTGKPKTTDDLKRTVYLRVMNNKISDLVENVFTSDHVPVDLKLSFTVDFEDDPEKWFNIENYVKFLCDHVRSILKGRIRKVGIKEFWASGADFIRDFVLGESIQGEGRPGMKFEQNGMRITDVEILDISIKNEHIAQMLQEAEEKVVSSHIELEQAERELQNLTRQEEISRDTLKARHDTTELKGKLEQKVVKIGLDTTLGKEHARQEGAKAEQTSTLEKEKVQDLQHSAKLVRDKAQEDQGHEQKVAQAELDLQRIESETAALTERFKSMQEGFMEGMLTLSNQDALVKIAQAGSVQSMLGGSNLVDIITKIVGKSPLAEQVKKIAQRAGIPF